METLSTVLTPVRALCGGQIRASGDTTHRRRGTREEAVAHTAQRRHTGRRTTHSTQRSPDAPLDRAFPFVRPHAADIRMPRPAQRATTKREQGARDDSADTAAAAENERLGKSICRPATPPFCSPRCCSSFSRVVCAHRSLFLQCICASSAATAPLSTDALLRKPKPQQTGEPKSPTTTTNANQGDERAGT